MTIKIKLTDGTVFEGTAEEIAELQKLLVYKNGAKPKCKDEDSTEKFEVGDYAKVTGLTFFGDITEGSYVKIVEDIDYDGEHKIELIDGSEYDYTKPEALEKVELTDRELTFLKAGRKPGEFKVGDLVEVIDYHDTIPKNSIVEIVKKYSDGDVLTKKTEGTMSYLFEPKHIELIAPVEARVDR